MKQSEKCEFCGRRHKKFVKRCEGCGGMRGNYHPCKKCGYMSKVEMAVKELPEKVKERRDKIREARGTIKQ